jgi:hypothetical protein
MVLILRTRSADLCLVHVKIETVRCRLLCSPCPKVLSKSVPKAFIIQTKRLSKSVPKGLTRHSPHQMVHRSTTSCPPFAPTSCVPTVRTSTSRTHWHWYTQDTYSTSAQQPPRCTQPTGTSYSTTPIWRSTAECLHTECCRT